MSAHRKTRNPRNPYESHVVRASAGCGKTFQLSQRFLALVAAGADPGTILTVTFTRKAAAEMRERILSDAGKLLAGGKEAAAFDQEMRCFFEAARESVLAAQGLAIPPPRPAVETGRIIITQSQALRIATIDSIFHDWVAKFPAETGLSTSDGTPLKLASDLDHHLMDAKAWDKAYLAYLSSGPATDDDPDGSDSHGDDENGSRAADDEDSSRKTLNLARELTRFSSFIWHLEESGSNDWLLAPAPEDPEEILRDLFNGLAGEWHQLADCLKRERRDELLATLGPSRDFNSRFEDLLAGGYVTKSMALNRRVFTDKATEPAAGARLAINACLARIDNTRKLDRLRAKGIAARQIFDTYRHVLRKIKEDAGLITFDDLLAGSSRIFHDPYAAGARYLLQRRIRHLMLDEFQDTSWPQWNVFREIALEVLSASDQEIPGSVFLVGDEKQSIYGFRNSDPEIMSDAARSLSSHGVLESPLNDSFRTSATVLDFVNEACRHMPGFPRHAAAQIDGKPVNPDVGAVTVLPVSTGHLDGNDLSIIEASTLAAWLRDRLSGNGSCPVYDKAAGTWRALEPRDCAILFRASDRMDVVERALQKQQIPSVREESSRLFEHQEVRDCMELLRLIARPGDLSALLAVLKSPFAGLADEFLAEALDATAGEHRRSPLRAGFMMEKLRTGAAAPDIEWLPPVLARVGAAKPSILLQASLDTSRYRERASLSRTAVESRVVESNLAAFLDLVRDLESENDDNVHAVGATARLMTRITNLKAGGGDSASDINAVRLMTVHKSKGLEFPLVAIFDTAVPWVKEPAGWLKYQDESGGGMVYLGGRKSRPDNHAATRAMFDAALASEVAEANRVWYVALTRARQYLALSGSARKEDESFEAMIARLGTSDGKPLLDHGTCVAALRSMPRVKSMKLSVPVILPLQSGTIDDTATPVIEMEYLTVESDHLRGTGVGKTGSSALRAQDDETPVVLGPEAEESPLPPLPVPFGVKILVASRFPAKRPASATAMPDDSVPENAREVDPESGTSLNGHIAAAIGTFVHAGLEHAVRELPFRGDHIWLRICDANLLNDTDAPVQLAFTTATSQLRHVLESATWKDLIQPWSRRRAEVPVLLLDRAKNLHSGTIDLLLDDARPLQAPTQLLIVDFKTSAVDGDAAEHAAQHGYFDQVKAYATTLQQSFPDAKIAGCIFYTRLLRTIDVPL